MALVLSSWSGKGQAAVRVIAGIWGAVAGWPGRERDEVRVCDGNQVYA